MGLKSCEVRELDLNCEDFFRTYGVCEMLRVVMSFLKLVLVFFVSDLEKKKKVVEIRVPVCVCCVH